MNIISRADTVKQKIERNIHYIYKISGKLDLKYSHIRVFHYINGMYGLVVEKNVPLWKINLDSEIESLEEVLNDSKFFKLKEDKAVTSLYNYVLKTNEMIKTKYKYKIKKFMNFK
ncbi:hypothetical protein [Clostridium saccharobutylicum]|uniref:Uncharacterized protein n=1 Tax=Clostridium saccharobutylicum TaxID=169679 RepID=A0A1S8MYZ0_CLOSA|nr:hypothetical protein [Clostridium saccharobutylicum]OOM09418.1 hypothetical protein CLOSAC_36990 [Clostridium saccharobutylicum]